MNCLKPRLALGLVMGCVALGLPHAESRAQEKGVLKLQPGDTIVLLGGTLVEREQRYGWLETKLNLALPEAKLKVRNLGWSGDTVFGDARSYFGPPQEGLDRLKEHLKMLKPNVVVFCYGADLAFEGLGGLPDFLTGYRKLLDLVRAETADVELAILAPPPLESLPKPMPDLTRENRNLESLRDALKKFAQMQNVVFLDGFEIMGGMPPAGRVKQPLTENGVHYTEAGYDRFTTALLRSFALTIPEVATPQFEALRAAVKRKDALFFNRWRPQNETYLFGFRKHEQGQNAREVPMFDPLIEKADESVWKARDEALASAPRP
ncbi:MAG: SGNH/GDSL hydrolase family protein [Verrucomicrobiales bacterium]|nr:SGNH/GDSL hydrolase family protein [Verrucomicrobiales bacterium]